MQSSLTYINLAAQVSTIIALVFTALAYFRERKSKQKLEQRAKILVWSDIAKLRGLMTDLEKPCEGGLDYGKHQAVGKLTSMYRDKIREVYELTPEVRPESIRDWRATGKIASNWQEQCFWEAFPQNRLGGYQKALDCDFTSSDELPDTHDMAAKPKSAS